MGVTWYGEEMAGRARAGAMRGVVRWIGMVEQRWVELLTIEQKTGRVYTRRGIKHQASAPGEPPASDTGTLLNSRRIDLMDERLAARMLITARHAAPLEFGTRDMEPRPHAIRALEETSAAGREAVIEEVMDALWY